ncbi:MAG: VOC family protein [Bdellovibrionales bacterium]
MAKFTPDGYHSITPYLVVRDAAQAIEFYKKAFGAEELYRLEMDGGKIGHAEIKIGDSPVMIADEYPDMGYNSPLALKGTPVSLMIYVKDVDTFAANAVKHGLKMKKPIEDRFYGDRNGSFQDPYGHEWTIATHKEDVSPDEIKKRAEKLFSGEGSGGH